MYSKTNPCLNYKIGTKKVDCGQVKKSHDLQITENQILILKIKLKKELFGVFLFLLFK